VASKSKRPIEAAHDRDRIIVRLPDGMRDKLADLAQANGRSMTAEAVAAIERHLQGTNRIAELWEFFEKHRSNIEMISVIRAAVINLEIYAESTGGGQFRSWGMSAIHRENKRQTEIAALPKLTDEQAAEIRRLLAERGLNEKRLLRYLNAPTIEEIHGFERALSAVDLGPKNKKSPPA
jgi:Arc-like DNA binding domain